MKKTKKKKRRKMTEEELVQKYRLEYQQNQKDYQACVERFGPRPQLNGTETSEQRKGVVKAQEAWDYFFENDTFKTFDN